MFLAILGLLPAIPHIVLGIEKLFGHGNGSAKKQAATSAIGDMINIFGQLGGNASSANGAGANSDMMTFVDELIESTVKLLNANGTLSHGTK